MAMSNTPLMAFSLSPAHFDRIMDGLRDSSVKPASAATFSTSRVLPVPGGPYSRKVWGGWRMPVNLQRGSTAAGAGVVMSVSVPHHASTRTSCRGHFLRAAMRQLVSKISLAVLMTW